MQDMRQSLAQGEHVFGTDLPWELELPRLGILALYRRICSPRGLGDHLKGGIGIY